TPHAGNRSIRCPHTIIVAARHARSAIGGHPTDLDDVFDMRLVSRASGPPHHITFGRNWTPWIQQIPFLRSSGATRKRLKPAGNRIHAKRANLIPVEPRSRRPHATTATNSRTLIVLTRC